MSLDNPKPGNPDWKKANPNPNGRPKGALGKKNHPKVQERLFGKWKTHPVDKLVQIANYLQNTGDTADMVEAAAIWDKLLRYCEPTKKPIESAPEKTTPADSKAAAEETYRLLAEIEQNESSTISPSEGSGVEKRTPEVSPEASSEENL